MCEGRSKWRPVILGVLCLALSLPALADEEPTPFPARLAISDGGLTASFDVTAAFNEAFRKRVIGGLRSVVLIEARLTDEHDQVLSQVARQCNLVRDVWDEVLTVHIRESNRRAERRFGIIDRGLAECGVVEDLRLGPASAFNNEGPYFLDVRVSLNPVDQETLESAREFMANPRGNREGRPQTFFGAIAQLFSSKPETNIESYDFRASRLFRPRRSL
ncbi:MAG: hypothetical protein U1E65_00780 [Myxococcota bacterium]